MREKHIKQGQFITLEGIEGVGKSTHLQFIRRYLKKAGVSFIITREPGGTLVAEAIRKVLLMQHKEIITHQTELLLMFAGRSQHIANVIQPALDAGQWVICDRFTDATYAYQGSGRGIPAEEIATLEQSVQGTLRPDHVFLFDAPVRVALRRAKGRGKTDRFEAEHEDFFKRVRGGYLERANQFPQVYKIIDARQPLKKVQNQIVKVMDHLLENCPHLLIEKSTSPSHPHFEKGAKSLDHHLEKGPTPPKYFSEHEQPQKKGYEGRRG